jgi:hypothetical protein
MIKRKRIVILFAALAFLGLGACKNAETQKDNAPEKLTGVITTIYSSDVPLPTGAHCTIGSFTVQVPDGTVYSVCASSKGEFTSAKVGATYSRS